MVASTSAGNVAVRSCARRAANRAIGAIVSRVARSHRGAACRLAIGAGIEDGQEAAFGLGAARHGESSRSQSGHGLQGAGDLEQMTGIIGRPRTCVEAKVVGAIPTAPAGRLRAPATMATCSLPGFRFPEC